MATIIMRIKRRCLRPEEYTLINSYVPKNYTEAVDELTIKQIEAELRHKVIIKR